MDAAERWIKKQIACYGAVAAIVIEQLNSAPVSTVTESPTPLVRIREASTASSDWDPGELVTRGSGRVDVLIIGEDAGRRNPVMLDN